MGSIQKAIYARLSADATLTSLGVLGVFDAVPHKQATPYIVIGDGTEIPFDTFGKGGHDDTVAIYTYTGGDESAEGFKPGLDIASRIATLLEDTALTIESHGTSVMCDCEFTQTLREEDGVERQVLQRFRVVCQDA